MSDTRSDHERVITSGAWWLVFAGSLFMVWVSANVPYAVAWLLNSAIMTGASYAMARYKRRWYAWASFWLIVGVCAANGILKAFTPLLNAPWSGASWIIAWVVVGSWYWLIRIGRQHPPKLPDVTHIVHHHVFHHPDGRAVEVGQSGTVPAGTVPAELTASAWQEVGQRAPIALENLANRPGLFPGRRAELAEAIRRVVKGKIEP